MKKLLIFVGAVLLGVGAFGVSGKKAVKAGATAGSEVQVLLRSYNDGGYTKKTQMYLTDDAVDELAEYFHAGQNTLKRATYYTADEHSLLMGNYDGTFGGVGGINGGFRNISAVACERFHYTDETPDVDNLFSAEHTAADYVAAGQTVGGYYQTLYSLSEAIDDSWVKDGDAYIYNLGEITVTDGEYNNPVLKKFQYFAAPMMLQNAYFSWHSIRVVEGASFLSIRLYSTRASGEGKSTMLGSDEALISEARVYKGINLNPEVTWTLKGSFDSWSDGEALQYQADLYNPEQYAITKNLSYGDQIKFNCESTYLGYDQLENTEWFFRWNDGEGDNNIIVKLSGEYTFYLKPKSNAVYAAVPSNGYIDIPLNLSSEWKSDGAIFYAYVWIGSGDDKVEEFFKANADGTSVRITGLYHNMILLRKSPDHDTSDWFGVWNQTQDLTIDHLKTLKINGWDSANATWVSA